MLCRKPENDFKCERIVKIETLEELPSKKNTIKAKSFSEEEYIRFKKEENDTSPYGLIRRVINNVFGCIQSKSTKS